MRYEIFIKRQAKKTLQNLSRLDRNRITERIVRLGNNPDDKRLDVKRLKGLALYRLRIGDWRIIYSRDDEIRIIAIENIGARGDIYK